MLLLAVQRLPLYLVLSSMDTSQPFQNLVPHKSIATTLGHQDQESIIFHSTHLSPSNLLVFNISIAPVTLTQTLHQCLSHAPSNLRFPRATLIKSYSNQTGKFPIPSSRGNHYIIVLYHQDTTNTIHAVALPNRQAASICDAWEYTHKILVQQGHPPELHILDNECSQDLKNSFLKCNIQFQCVLQKEYCVNAAERAICTFKSIHMTVGGNLLEVTFDVCSPAISLPDM